VRLLTEVFCEAPADGLAFVRPISNNAGPMPLAIARALAGARRGQKVQAALHQGWFIEPFFAPKTPVWVWGAGHVGRAIVGVMAPLPDVEITWIDTDLARFPDIIAAGVRALPAADITRAVALAPADAHHVILTFSHALDLALCDGLLKHGFAACGLIGSATKWARFRARLAALGHAPADISRIMCPIGDQILGKHPQAIAIGVAARMTAHMAAVPALHKEVRA
jgi:xanthine dehydrogenase accessory factor